jgi:hypothetical protein
MKVKDLVDLKGCYSAYDVGELEVNNVIKVVDMDEQGNSKEPCNLVCYHPLQIKRLLNGENIAPQCCGSRD